MTKGDERLDDDILSVSERGWATARFDLYKFIFAETLGPWNLKNLHIFQSLNVFVVLLYFNEVHT